MILYELLAGRLPYDISTQAARGAGRRSASRSRRGSARSTASFRGDVETIVAKALEKDKTRRYASAAELAADIRGYLKDEPIAARPPTRDATSCRSSPGGTRRWSAASPRCSSCSSPAWWSARGRRCAPAGPRPPHSAIATARRLRSEPPRWHGTKRCRHSVRRSPPRVSGEAGTRSRGGREGTRRYRVGHRESRERVHAEEPLRAGHRRRRSAARRPDLDRQRRARSRGGEHRRPIHGRAAGRGRRSGGDRPRLHRTLAVGPGRRPARRVPRASPSPAGPGGRRHAEGHATARHHRRPPASMGTCAKPGWSASSTRSAGGSARIIRTPCSLRSSSRRPTCRTLSRRKPSRLLHAPLRASGVLVARRTKRPSKRCSFTRWFWSRKRSSPTHSGWPKAHTRRRGACSATRTR